MTLDFVARICILTTFYAAVIRATTVHKPNSGGYRALCLAIHLRHFLCKEILTPPQSGSNVSSTVLCTPIQKVHFRSIQAGMCRPDMREFNVKKAM